MSNMRFVSRSEFRKIRESLGLTQTELGREMGVTFRTVSRWETGEFPIPRLAELALRSVVQEAKQKTVPWEKIKKELGLKFRPQKH